MAVHVVVAEDDVKQAELVRRYLEHDGHDVTVVHDGPAAVDAVRLTAADVLVLDVMLPGLDGFSVCRTLGPDSGVAVLMLTARTHEDDMIRGLDSGADDYITKPFSPRELSARVRALLRRSHRGGGSSLRVGDLILDTDGREATCDGQPISLTPAEFALLEHVARSPGRVFSRSQLLDLLHGSDQFITQRTVDMHVMNLRRKIEADPRRPSRLLTVYGVGYKLAPS